MLEVIHTAAAYTTREKSMILEGKVAKLEDQLGLTESQAPAAEVTEQPKEI